MFGVRSRGPGDAALITGVTLAPGVASGQRLLLPEPLSFWGGFDPVRGVIIDRWHPCVGQCVAGRVMLMPGGRGSSSGSASLAESLRRGVGPAAILLLRRDPIVIVGALVAAELYALQCPVVLVERWDALAAARWLEIRADGDGAEIDAHD